MLPSGPGGVRRIPLRGAQPSTPSCTVHSTRATLKRGFNPAIADCGLQGTATSPSSTAKPAGRPRRGHLPRWRARLHAQRTESTPRVHPSRAASHMPPSRPSGAFASCFLLAKPRGQAARSANYPHRMKLADVVRIRLSGKLWRRGWDSNPRYSCPYTAFPVPHLRPLGHPSDCCALPIDFSFSSLLPAAISAPAAVNENGGGERI